MVVAPVAGVLTALVAVVTAGPTTIAVVGVTTVLVVVAMVVDVVDVVVVAASFSSSPELRAATVTMRTITPMIARIHPSVEAVVLFAFSSLGFAGDESVMPKRYAVAKPRTVPNVIRRRVLAVVAAVIGVLGLTSVAAPHAEAKLIVNNCIVIPVPTGGGTLGACFQRLPALPI